MIPEVDVGFLQAPACFMLVFSGQGSEDYDIGAMNPRPVRTALSVDRPRCNPTSTTTSSPYQAEYLPLT